MKRLGIAAVGLALVVAAALTGPLASGAGSRLTSGTRVDDTSAEAGSGMKTLPEGIIRVNGFGRRVSLPEGFFQTYPWVAGFAAIERWSDLQPTETGPIDWSYLDGQRDRAGADGKPLVLIVKTGAGATSATPGWLTGDPCYRPVLPIPDGETSVVPWDDVILDKWLLLSQQIADRYDVDPRVVGIYVAGVNAQYPEMWFTRSEDWADNAKVAPNPPFDSPDGAVYSSAWTRALQTMTNQFERTWLVNMLDVPPLPAPSGWATPVFNTVVDEIDRAHSDRATYGTANMGYSADLTDYEFQELRASHPERKAPIVYEIGPKKLDESVPDDLYLALRDCRVVLGCRAAFVHGTTWNTGQNRSEAERAYNEFWTPVGGIADLPPMAGIDGSPAQNYAIAAVLAFVAVVALMASAWYARRRWGR